MKYIGKGALSYLFYLVCLFVFLIVSMTIEVRLVPVFSISVNFSSMINFLDLLSLVLILAFCLLMLVCTNSLRAFKGAFVFMFKDSVYSVQQLGESLLSVKVAIFSAIIGGGIHFVAQLVNALHGMYLSSAGESFVVMNIAISLLSLAYSLVILLILMPIYVSLARSLSLANQGEKPQKVAVPHKKKN